MLAALRGGLRRRGYVEVETPVLTSTHGGAAARPFRHHSNALAIDLYLRIALELYLKRLVVGGIEQVYEIGRNFRNEGVDTSHNPEFTMLEFYATYHDYDVMAADHPRSSSSKCADALGSRDRVRRQRRPGRRDRSRRTMAKRDGARRRLRGASVSSVTIETPASTSCAGWPRRPSVCLKPEWNAGQVLLELYEQLVEGRTVAPTFYRDFPVEVSPLVRQHRTDPRLTERWDLVVLGRELGTGYTELVDPVEQRARLTEQSLLAAGGDPGSNAARHRTSCAPSNIAMPPTGGVGVGIERLLMVLTGATSIREVLAFPLTRDE